MMNAHRADDSISHHLTVDHQRLDALFADAGHFAGAGDFARARRTFGEFARGLAHHIDVEERVLFPELDARVPIPGPTTVMRSEHRILEKLFAAGEAALARDEGAGYATIAAELAAILRAHNMKEERVLYPRCDAALDEPARGAVVAALGR